MKRLVFAFAVVGLMGCPKPEPAVPAADSVVAPAPAPVQADSTVVAVPADTTKR